MPYKQSRESIAEILINEMREAMSKGRYDSKASDHEDAFDSDFLIERVKDILNNNDIAEVDDDRDSRIARLEEELRDLKNNNVYDEVDSYGDVKDALKRMTDRHERERDQMKSRHEREWELLKERQEREQVIMKRKMKDMKETKFEGNGRSPVKPGRDGHPGNHGRSNRQPR